MTTRFAGNLSTYRCHRLAVAIRIGEGLSASGWAALPWSEDFVDITGNPGRPPRQRTRMKAGWDDHGLYVGAELEEADIWATLRERNARLCEENAFEVFLDPDGDGRNYYELEINALGTLWELALDRPYREGGVATSGNLPGLRSAVHIDGTLGDPSDIDRGWTVELAFPWSELARFHPAGATPPRPGDVWRLNCARVAWPFAVVNGQYVRVPPPGTPRNPAPASEGSERPSTGDGERPASAGSERPDSYSVWSAHGEFNMHRPDRWGRLVFSED